MRTLATEPEEAVPVGGCLGDFACALLGRAQWKAGHQHMLKGKQLESKTLDSLNPKPLNAKPLKPSC